MNDGLNQDLQDSRICRIFGEATRHPENPKIPRILILTNALSESGFAGFKDLQDFWGSHGSS
jgi:hypothetical protein